MHSWNHKTLKKDVSKKHAGPWIALLLTALRIDCRHSKFLGSGGPMPSARFSLGHTSKHVFTSNARNSCLPQTCALQCCDRFKQQNCRPWNYIQKPIKLLLDIIQAFYPFLMNSTERPRKSSYLRFQNVHREPLVRSRKTKCISLPNFNPWKRLILNYLIPIRLLAGKLPSQVLFRKYPSLAVLYKDFVLAIRQGNVHLFDKTFSNLQNELIAHGTWLTIERARSLVIRTLFRKMYDLNSKNSSTDGSFKRKHQESISTFSSVDWSNRVRNLWKWRKWNAF